MKRFLYALLLIFAAYEINAQENVFILVDVSKSVKQSELNNSKQLLIDLCNGSSIDLTKWRIVGGSLSHYSLLRRGGRLMIMPFGNSSTIMSYTPNIKQVNNSQEAINIINTTFNFNPTDNSTYLALAKAKCAVIAKDNGIDKYQLIIVSDNVNDDYGGPNSKPNYSPYEQSLIDEFGTQNNPVNITGSAITIKSNFNSLFSVSVGTIYDVTGYTPPKIGGSQSNDSISAPLKIELTTFKGGTSSRPIVHKENKITVGWFCKNAPKNAQYKIRVSPIGISGEKTQTYTVSGNSYNVTKLSNGKWMITVSSGDTNFKAKGDTTYIKIKSGCSNCWWWLLLIPLAIFSYWYWKKIQDDKIKKLNSMSNNDSFSSGSTLNTNSDNSGYF